MESEILLALNSFKATKVPGPDCFIPLFFLYCWDIIKTDLIYTIQTFFSTGHLPTGINHTFLAFIIKSYSANTVSQFCPISLCNTSYKIISKILASRIEPFLNDKISPHQSAFIKGRLIQENSIIAFEALHSVKKKGGRGVTMAYKVDMEKAFDKKEGDLVLYALSNFGLPPFLNWIYSCLSTLFFSILLNGSPL